MSELPSITAVVLNHQGEELLPWGLPSILEEAGRYSGHCEVWVIDNASTDASLAVLTDRFPEVRVIPHDNDVLASYNDVAATVETETLLLLNNDVRVHPGSFEALGGALAPGDLCVGGRLVEDDGALQAGRTRGRLLHGLLRFERDLDNDVEGPTSFAAAAFCLVRTQRFLDLGGFDPVFHPGYLEDADLCLRGWARGWRSTFTPDAVATHRDRATFSRTYPQETLDTVWLRNEMLLTDKHIGRTPAVRLWAMVRAVRGGRIVADATREARQRRDSLRREDAAGPKVLERFRSFR